MNKIGVTTHVLDISTGWPAPDIALVLERRAGQNWQCIGRTATNADGRAAFSEVPQSGDYRLTFEVAAYFAARDVTAFYPLVQINFRVPENGATHYHVPLLLGPFGYSTYRGS